MNKIYKGIGLFILIIVTGVILNKNYTMQQQQKNLNQKPANISEKVSQEESITCSGKLIPELTEGPYYTGDTPEKTNFIEEGVLGEKIHLSGYVLDTNCKPIANAWLDFWQADGEGNYDNSGYRLRGHQFTDNNGKYTLETVIPGEYPGRTPHIHVKVRANKNSKIITTQLFLPNESQNETDSIFDESLIMDIKEASDGKSASYNFVINTE